MRQREGGMERRASQGYVFLDGWRRQYRGAARWARTHSPGHGEVRSRGVILWPLVGVLLLGGFSAAAAPVPDPLDAPPFTASPSDLQGFAEGIHAPAGTPAVVLLEETSYRFDGEGRYTRSLHLIYRILTDKGVDGWDSTSALWEPWHQHRPEIRARVITADRAVHILDDRTLAESTEGEVDADVYSDRKVLQGPLPAVARGAVVELEIVDRETAPFFAGGSVHHVLFGNGVPTERTRLTIMPPTSRHLSGSGWRR